MCSSQVMGTTICKKFVVQENEFMPVNTSLPLSTNEVKPYLQEVETKGSIGKERGKGLTSSSMLSGQVMGTKMHKNSVVCENEYIQVDTPFSPSTNQVKQRTKEAEAKAIGKGPEGGDVRMRTIPKNSMVLEKAYMQVDTTFSPSTNQVKQRTKEAETRGFKNSVGSNQGMQSMANNPLILGKENMQTNISLPPFPAKVMKPSKTVEIEKI
ncbi:putative protein isoform X3 [Capsicum galapagoense]